MNCPSCNRNLASTLSVCPSCGTMVFDSVREELALKISPIVKTTTGELKEKPVISITPVLPTPAIKPPVVVMQTPPVKMIIEEPVVKKPQTAELAVKPTSPTLVEFNNKNATLPDWRLQVQNAVVKRRGTRETPEVDIKPQVAMSAKSRRTGLVTKGATALKAQIQIEEKPAPVPLTDSPLDRALRRIEKSRQTYLVEEAEAIPQAVANQSSVKYFPSVMQNRPQEFSSKTNQAQTIARFVTKPNVTSINGLKAEKFDTNKLPPLPARISSSFENRPVVHTNLDLDTEDERFIGDTIDNTPEVAAYSETSAIENAPETEEIDDCAPLSLRFNAAIFDLLIGSFLSLLLLSPFMLLNGKFFSTEGFLAFLATCAIVMFVYMTATVGFLGRTLGMKLFSLEIVDIDENAYPTIHQAAVSSSVYLVSLALGGLGFLTLLLNNEKRAAHDLLSGTIIVKEY